MFDKICRSVAEAFKLITVARYLCVCFIDIESKAYNFIFVHPFLFPNMSTREQESPEQESHRSLSQPHDFSVKDEIIEEDREFSPVPYRRHATVKRTSVHLPGWNSRKLIRNDVPNADGWHLNSDRSSRD